MTKNDKLARFILFFAGAAVLVIGIILVFIPPALFPDPANGFQVLRSMHLGGGFNNIVAPDQSDISQDYTEFLTWWSPGQYLVPWFFKLIFGLNLGRGIAIAVFLGTISGLAGLYCFLKKLGISKLISALTILFIFFQVAFFVPFVYYNGGEILLFSFLGWFLYGCASLDKPGIKLVLFVLLTGWLGFFFKSSFVWMYAAGLFCLWIRLSNAKSKSWLKNGLWIGIPAILSLAVIYVVFLSKGQSPANAAHGLKITAETFSFPLASPVLSAFSIDDLAHGLIYHFGPRVFSPSMSLLILLFAMILSILVIWMIVRLVPNKSYQLFVLVFYVAAFLFFSFSYMRQLDISYEARHFRIVGILILPGVFTLLSGARLGYKLVFALAWAGIGVYSVRYIVKGYYQNAGVSAHGVTGISQPGIDQASLNKVMQLDNANRNAVFVFINNDTGLEIRRNRLITLPQIGDNLTIDADDYTYDGFGGPLYIILPETYNGPKEKMIMKSFPGYTGWDVSMLSNDYVLYTAKMKRTSK